MRGTSNVGRSFTLLLGMLAAGIATAAPTCYSGSAGYDPFKPNKLYVYFPSGADASFPTWDPAEPIAITGAFNPAGFGGGYAEPAMSNAIYDVVASDYCEFNVHVIKTTTNPDLLPAPPARRNMVAIGSDSDTGGTYQLYGLAEAVDTGDADPIDHARVWGGSYDAFTSCSGPGGPLTGGGDTLQRWAFGIGGTAAHEAGHNYGLSHGNGAIVNPGEDGLTNHIMPAGPSVPCTERVDQRRHFNDTNFGILANNVGLTVQTLTNWDFVNPNTSNAHALRMEVLSTAGSLVSAWVYQGGHSPWLPPAIASLPGTVTFQGVVYNRYQITWSADKAWQSSNQPAPASTAGLVRPAEIFHVGLTFSGVNVFTDPVIVRDVDLLDASNNELPLNPRTPSYNPGAMDVLSGDFLVALFNLFDTPLIVRELRVFQLPRQADIGAMVSELVEQQEFFDVRGDKFRPWKSIQIGLPGDGLLLPAKGERVDPLRLGNVFKDGHNVRIVSPRDPNSGDAEVFPEKNPDVVGTLHTDPFPAAAVLLAAVVEDPSVEYFDPGQDKMVRATTRMFFQVNGKRVKPVIGRLRELFGAKVVCVNLNTRRTAALDVGQGAGEFDCERSGLLSFHGDRVEITQKGTVRNPAQFEVEMAGMNVEKVVCVNLSKRNSVAFDVLEPGPINCAQAGLEMAPGDQINVTQKGTAR